jgi:hypothetical protein
MSVSFAAHVALLNEFLTRRRAIAERIESTLLNVRGKPLAVSRDRSRFDRLLNACFFGLPALPADLAVLQGQLHASHLADGFEPVQIDQFANEFDPLELIVRAYEFWGQHRWPGFSGRLAYAQTIYAAVVLRQLEYLSLRVWDDGDEHAGDRLADVQQLLDRLNDSALCPPFVRDARWLMQTAQGPFTRHLSPYFQVAGHVSGSFTPAVRLGIHAAGAKLAGGHLRSQLRYRMWSTGRPIDDPENLAFTRNSNSMDGALLVRDLVPLLDAYRIACEAGAREERLNLADAILQGLSADPELFVVRLDLLTPCTIVEDLFIERGADGHPRYTALGETQMDLLARYRDRIAQLAEPLHADAIDMDPARHIYAPLGITYGFCADILSNMAIDTLVLHPAYGLSLEDVFDSSTESDSNLARATGWARLPRRVGEREHFDHSAEYAAQNFRRLIRALEARRIGGRALNASDRPDARVFVMSRGSGVEAAVPPGVPAGCVVADEYCFATDEARVEAGATVWPKDQLLKDRAEGRYLASAESDGCWVGLSKVTLTRITGQGHDALFTAVPQSLAEILRLTCPGLVVHVPDAR